MKSNSPLKFHGEQYGTSGKYYVNKQMSLTVQRKIDQKKLNVLGSGMYVNKLKMLNETIKMPTSPKMNFQRVLLPLSKESLTNQKYEQSPLDSAIST